ncbi:MAG TPA: hypothetical protein VMM36_18150 [Opitutaceae bacterium]|nr:hypothetical protein [Opitutaceae bacterium]
MDPRFTACPHLPPPREGMDWSHFRVHGIRRDGAFYRTAIEYGHFLWNRGLPARAMLCLDRALGSNLRGDERELIEWPLPYRAMAWILAHAPPDVFIGNPRVHFQHLADRMPGPRREQRAARAWACWVIARAVLPHLPGDPRHDVVEPTEDEVALLLEKHGIAGEVALWRSVVSEALAERDR